MFKNFKFKIKNFERGQLLVELILVMGLFALLLPALLTAFTASREGKAQQEQRQAATALLKETEVAVKAIKNSSWTTISSAQTGQPYYPSVSGSSWTLTGGSETVGNFTRSLNINSVQRNSSGAIVGSGGTVDPSTRQIVITVSWDDPTTSAITSTLYLTRTDNMTYTETTQAQFTPGTETGTVVTNTSGGEIVLASGGAGDWCDPNLTITALDLPKNGVANGIAAIEGRAFAGTGENASGESFANINITNANPPVATTLGTFSNYKTNDVFGESNYGYIATDTNGKEIVIINLSNYTESGYFDASGSTDANSVFVSGNTGYMTQGTRLRNFNLTSKTGSRAAIDADGVGLSGTGTAVYVVGTYAYVSLAGASREMEIVSLSNPSNLQVVGYADVNGQAARDVYVNPSGTRAYIVTDASSTLNEFFIINTSSKTGSRPLVGSYSAGSLVDLKGVEVVSNNKAVIIGSGGEEEYQVLDITTESNPTKCGGMNVDAGVFDSASVLEADGDAYTYIVTGDAAAEFKIIEGGPGGQYATTGTFESATYDAGSAISFNRFVATVSQPSETTLQMQVAAAAPVSGSCPTLSSAYTFVGPNGNTSAFFTPTGSEISGAIPFGSYSPSYVNPERCFRYKAFFDTTDSTQTPVLYDVIINRAP